MATIDPSGSAPLPESTTHLNPSTATTPQVINVGTRKSALALIQAEMVIDQLKKAWPENDYKICAISTMGDKNQVTALHEFNAKSLWTFELENMLMEREVDFIVHCLKDMPTQLPKNCALGAILERGDPRDALVLHPSLPSTTTLSSLPADSVIGTSSVRRSAQLKRLYPHLRFQSVRGNVGTRLRKLDESNIDGTAGDSAGSKKGEAATVDEQRGTNYSALILAAAGLIRLDLQHRISRYFGSNNIEQVNSSSEAGSGAASVATTADGKPQSKKGMLYAVGQGSLAIETRAGDERIQDILRPLQSPSSGYACLAERSLMRTLEGGCSVPIGVETEWVGDATGAIPASGTTAGNLGETNGALDAESSRLITENGDKDHLVLRAIVVSLDGNDAAEAEMKRVVKTEAEAEQLGWDVAQLLVQRGADKILEAINLDRRIVQEQGDA